MKLPQEKCSCCEKYLKDGPEYWLLTLEVKSTLYGRQRYRRLFCGRCRTSAGYKHQWELFAEMYPTTHRIGFARFSTTTGEMLECKPLPITDNEQGTKQPGKNPPQ